MLSTYYLSQDKQILATALSYIGIPGGDSYSTSYYKNMEHVNFRLMEVCVKIVKGGLIAEIKATITKKLGTKYTEEEVIMYIQNCISNSGYFPEEIKAIGVIASYDMKWNQCAKGRIYNSLSGQRCMIGCRPGCIIMFGVKSKICS